MYVIRTDYYLIAKNRDPTYNPTPR